MLITTVLFTDLDKLTSSDLHMVVRYLAQANFHHYLKKNGVHFKRGHKCRLNIHLVLLVQIRDTLCKTEVSKSFRYCPKQWKHNILQIILNIEINPGCANAFGGDYATRGSLVFETPAVDHRLVFELLKL